MVKTAPHCKLAVVKRLVKEGRVRSTTSALVGGAALGFDFDAMVQIVLALVPADFYKSMTTHADHKIWQDVYHHSTVGGDVYLKLTIIDDVLIVSFKDL